VVAAGVPLHGAVRLSQSDRGATDDVAPPSTGYPRPPRPLAAWAFEHYVRRQARRHFTAVHWRAERADVLADRGVPTIFVANHTNWWDGFLGYLVSRALGLGFRVLMEERNLARYRVFLRVGALPLRRTSAREAHADLRAARAHLVPGVSLWVYPQGSRRPAAERPGALGGGAAQLALELAAELGRPVRLCPVALRYGFLGEQLPEAFVLVGEPWPVPPSPRASGAERRVLTAEVARRLGETLDALDARLAAEDLRGFEPLVRGRLSVNKRMDRFRHRVGLLRGEFEARNG
jgi:1-acyl-sn-glycerol-3-phosphate acyltransferase